jgi:hypothetical protein
MPILWSISINILNKGYYFKKTAGIMVEKSKKGLSQYILYHYCTSVVFIG